MIAIIATTMPISIRYANIFANMYPRNNDMIIRIARETGDEINQHFSTIIRKIINAKIIVNMPTIINLFVIIICVAFFCGICAL